MEHHVILYGGSFQIVPVMALTMVALQIAALVSFWSVVLRAVTTDLFDARLPAAATLVIVLVVAEFVSRFRAKNRRAREAVSLRATAESRRIGPSAIGSKSSSLAQLAGAGVRVPRGVAITPAACHRIASRGRLPWSVRRELRRCFGGGRPTQLIVRSSFVGEDGDRIFAGVFESVPDVASDAESDLVAAIREVTASGQKEVAAHYRKHFDVDESPLPAVLVQRQLDAEIIGVCFSLGWDGRSDWIVVEYREGGGELIRVVWDVIAQVALQESGRHARPGPWMDTLARTVLRSEQILASSSSGVQRPPIQMEFGVEDGELYVLQARRVPARTPRRTWVAEGPVEFDRTAPGRLVRDLRGSLTEELHMLETPARALGIRLPLSEENLTEFEGVTYVDARALRRVLAAEPAASLLDGLRQLLAVLRGPGTVAIPAPPGVARPLGEAWESLLAWRHAHFLPAREAQAAATLRLAMVHRLLLADSEPAARTRWPSLESIGKRWLRRRFGRLAAERDRLRSELTRAEREFCDSVRELLLVARPTWGVPLREQDGHLHASFHSVEAALEGARMTRPDWLDRSPPSNALRPARIHEPPVNDEVDTAGGGVGVGRPISRGRFVGPLRWARTDDLETAHAAVVVVPDGSPDWYPWLLAAGAVVIESGGFLSHLATAAIEADKPAVLSSQHGLEGLDSGTMVTIDATQGSVRVES